MSDGPSLTDPRLKTPRAAAVAGIAFAVLLGTSHVLARLSVPARPLDDGTWLEERRGQVTFALSLVPFAGIAFLWFIGVLRDRLGRREDQFFSSVFFGSGLLYLAMTFAQAALAGGLIATYNVSPTQMLDSGLYQFGREVTHRITTIYATRMSAVFMISLGTIWYRTRTMPRWATLVTYALALVLLVSVSRVLWVTLVFPAWVLGISVYILATAPRLPEAGAGTGAAAGEV